MVNQVPAKYRLLVGPYRMALWAVLSRFKERFCSALADEFLANDIGVDEFSAHSIEAVSNGVDILNTELNKHRERKCHYETLLARFMRELTEQASVEDRVTTLRAIDPDNAAKTRVDHIERYLTDVVDTWSSLLLELRRSETTDSRLMARRSLYAAIAQLVWPYYGVVYERRSSVAGSSGVSPYNFCSWIPNATLFGLGCSSGENETSPSKSSLHNQSTLYPSIGTDTLSNSDLISYLNAASQASFDFDKPFGVAGHVQLLQNISAPPVVYPQLDKIFEGASSDVQSPFTDLFHFVNNAFRYLVRSADSSPVGVLFLSGPSLVALGALFGISSSDINEFLEGAIARSWNDVGGHRLSSSIHQDFLELRDELFSVMRAQDKLSGQESIGHTVKTLTEATGWREARQGLRKVLDGLKGGQVHASHADLRAIVPEIEFAFGSLGMFALPESMGHVLRMASALRTENYEKLRDWIEKDNKPWEGTELRRISNVYAKSIFAIAQCYCTGYLWKHLRVECPTADADCRNVSWTDADHSIDFDSLSLLHFPPFRKGSDVGNVFAFALVEPICNALTALSTAVTNGDADLAQSELRIQIDILPREREVKVTVENYSATPLPQQITGLEHVRRLLEDFELLSASSANSRPFGAYWIINSEMRFRPMKLHKKIVDRLGG